MPQEKTQQEINCSILDTYDSSDIFHPQVILRKVNQVDGYLHDDVLFGVKLSCYRYYEVDEIREKLPKEFYWAAQSIADFMIQYKSSMEQPAERVHLEALAQSGCRIFIEDRCSSTNGNSLVSEYIGQSTILAGKPAVKLVANKFNSSKTFLHEAIHNSDLRLSKYCSRKKIQ